MNSAVIAITAVIAKIFTPCVKSQAGSYITESFRPVEIDKYCFLQLPLMESSL